MALVYASIQDVNANALTQLLNSQVLKDHWLSPISPHASLQDFTVFPARDAISCTSGKHRED